MGSFLTGGCVHADLETEMEEEEEKAKEKIEEKVEREANEALDGEDNDGNKSKQAEKGAVTIADVSEDPNDPTKAEELDGELKDADGKATGLSLKHKKMEETLGEGGD